MYRGCSFNKKDATENLIEISKKYSGTTERRKTDKKWRNKKIRKKVEYALVNGINDFIEEDT